MSEITTNTIEYLHKINNFVVLSVRIDSATSRIESFRVRRTLKKYNTTYRMTLEGIVKEGHSDNVRLNGKIWRLDIDGMTYYSECELYNIMIFIESHISVNACKKIESILNKQIKEAIKKHKYPMLIP